MSPAPASARMRVGLDLLGLGGSRTGIEATAWWLAREMPAQAPEIDFIHFLPAGVEPPSAAANVNVVRIPVSRGRGGRLVAEQWTLPGIARRQRLDLLHAIAFATPWLYRGRTLQTVYDLGFLAVPGIMPWRYLAYWKWAYGTAARRCVRLVSISECTRDDFTRLLGWNPENVTVVPIGVDPAFTPAVDRAALEGRLDALGIPRPYVLFVGTLQPRKDVDTLLATFARLHAAHPELRLVLAGARGWGYPEPGVMARRHGVEGAVVHRQGATLGQVADLYRGAKLLLFPSLYEGFGLPPLEAMACGTPAVVTRCSALPEVCGDAALYGPVGDADALASQAERLLTDAAFAREMIARGALRAAGFTWPKAAAKMVDVYRQLAGGASRA